MLATAAADAARGRDAAVKNLEKLNCGDERRRAPVQMLN